MNGHPSFDILETEGTSLSGKHIILGITGSVAAVKAPDIARKLMRRGAHVHPVMTKAACDLISPDLMEWATGYKPVTHLTGAIEHVDLAGNVPVRADLLLIAPATANTISKIACGIDDTPVTTFVTTGFGEGLPLLIVPAMHQSMYDHPVVKDNIKKLEGYGVRFLHPREEEGKAKIPTSEDILGAVEEVLGIPGTRVKPWTGKRVLITAGRTVEFLDPIRVITNNSTGKMGMALAKAALDLGAEVQVVYGKGTEAAPQGVQVFSVSTAQEMKDAVEARLKDSPPDVFLAAAAVGDWTPKNRSEKKITTHGTETLVLELVPTPKILDQVKKISPSTLVVAFRAQAGLSDEQLETDGAQRREKAGADLIAINDTLRPGQGFEGDTNALLVLDREGRKESISLDSKQAVAVKLLAIIQKKFYS